MGANEAAVRRAVAGALAPAGGGTGARSPPRYRMAALRPSRGPPLSDVGQAPAAVVLPIATKEVSVVLRIAGRLLRSVVAWGGGTGLMGGARPRSDAIVLDLRRMRRVRGVDRGSCTATAEAGIILEDLDRRLRGHGLLLGHDPWSRPRATLGGAIGTNGLGYSGYLRGSMGDQVLGLEAVLAEGAVLRTRAVARSTTGLDLKQLFIGTEGTLGIVTAATIRAFPVPEREEIHAFRVPGFAEGFEALCRIYDDGLTPFVMNFEETFRVPGGPWPTGSGPPELVLGFRRPALAAVRRHGVHPLGFGLWTQPELVSLEMARPIRGDRRRAKAAVAAAIDDVLRRAQALGGSMEYVHGVGVALAHLIREELGPGLDVFRAVKGELDPSGRLNPGKLGL